MTLSIKPYKGARDFYPEDKRLQKYLFGVIVQAVERFGYEEYEAPILEPIELFLAKTGDEIVNEQTYSFEDRGGRRVVIRPEMTPSVSRMVAAKRQELAYPVRWYSIVDNWRYERPQHGRGRQFYQLNVDMFGISGLEADFENIQIADAVLKAFGAMPDMYEIRINSRKLMDSLMRDYLQLDETQSYTLSKLIDKMRKMDHAEFVAEVDALFAPSQRDAGASDQLLGFLKAKSLDEIPETMYTHDSIVELRRLLRLLEDSGITNAVFDPTLMRGFDYYTDIVFEVFDTNPENNRSMFGGGRYDGLVGLFGVEPVPTVGFAMGDITLQNFLQSHDLLPKLHTETDVYVILIGDVFEKAQKVLADLRENGVNAALDATGRKPDKQIKTALKKGIHYVLFIGEKELEEQQFTLKHLGSGQEERHSLQRIISIVKDYRRQDDDSL